MIILTALSIGILAGFILGYLFRGVMADSKTECCRPERWSACFQQGEDRWYKDSYGNYWFVKG